MTRIVMGGLVGGMAIFMWGAAFHMVLPFGEMGIRSIPNEEKVIGPMREVIREPGLYLFPGFDPGRKLSPEEQQAWEAKYRAGPTGLLVYRPVGRGPMSFEQLATQFVTDVLAALVVVFLLSLTSLPFGWRVLFVTMLGLFSWLSISMPYWNWYGFPADFTLAAAIDQVAGWFLAGLVIAAFGKPSAQA